jgi:hypothetical protein
MFEPNDTEWQDGDRVLAPWEPQWLYPGTIRCIDEDVAFIKFDDGDRAIVPLAELRPVALSRGDIVHCRRDRALRQYFPARVLDVHDEDLHVQYEDGDEDFTMVGFVRVPIDQPWEADVAQEN